MRLVWEGLDGHGQEFCLFFLWDWGLNSGLHACKAGVLPTFQSILLCFFFLFVFLFAALGLEPRTYTLSHSTSPFL
jgi:hypothetical protein